MLNNSSDTAADVSEPPSSDTGPSAPTSQFRFRALLAIGASLPVVLFLSLAAYALVSSRAQYEDRAELLTQNLSEALDAGLTANVEKVDMAVTVVVDHLEHMLRLGSLDLDDVSELIHSQSAQWQGLDGIRVTDVQGLGIAGPGVRNAAQPVSFSDREWFQVQRDNPDVGLLMSRPLVSKLNQELIISFSRRYRNPNGTFAGVVSAAVPLSYFVRQLQALKVGPHGSVVLRDRQLGLIARTTGGTLVHDEPVGSTVVSDALRGLVAKGMSRATYRAATPVDRVIRTYSFRRLERAPLVVLVSVSAMDYLSEWRSNVISIVGLCAMLLLLYGSSAVLLRRMWKQNRVARRRIELLAKVFDSSGEAIVVSDRNHRVVDVNPAFVRQTGYLPEEVIGHLPRVMDPQRSTRNDHLAIAAAIRKNGFWRGELWDRTKDGRDYRKWLSVSVLRDSSGRVTHHIASSIDVTELRQAEDQIRHLAHHDALTQLPNRALLHGRLEQALADARREHGALALMFIDMDHFKNINDTLGHPVGDGLLVDVAQRLQRLVRDSDIVARLGGDEFVVVLTRQDQNAASVAASTSAQIIDELSQPYMVHGHELHSTPSIGIALYPEDGTDPDTLMKHADVAMYHAKASGRNNFQRFTEDMNRRGTERLQLESGLRWAIARDELFLHFQPQLELTTGRIVGFESLVRWRHPEMGLVPPLKFIPVAEDTGQIEHIGEWVVRESLRQVAEWRRSSHGELRIAVNLSAKQLRGAGLVRRVQELLAEFQLPGDALELEITESVAMSDPAHTIRQLHELRQLGVVLAIDDFGTGYSSLAYLKQLPINCLKLDRSFVMDLEHDPNDAAICRATIQLAHSLGLGVVAEGVENKAQLEFLQRLGCDVVQGYFVGRPMPAADCAKFLSS